MAYKDKNKAAEYRKEYYERNREKINLQKRVWSLKNKQFYQEYRENHKEKAKEYRESYYENNKESFLSKRKKYVQENKVKIYKYIKEKEKIDPSFLLSNRLRSRFRIAFRRYLKEGISPKSSSAVRDLGCSLDFLQAYIENKFIDDMSWNNYGQFGWHIDHIIPINSFDLTKEEEQKKAVHYTNLQPMWWRENIIKGKNI